MKMETVVESAECPRALSSLLEEASQLGNFHNGSLNNETECARPLSSLLEEACEQNMSHNGCLNNVTEWESASSHIENKDLHSSEDEDNSSECFENTIIELEELIGSEEEFRLFIESMSGGDVPESVNTPSQVLDLNSNVFKGKAEIPVIDITSDDEGSEDKSTSESRFLMASLENLGTPNHNALYCDQDSPVVNSPIPASFKIPARSDLISLGVKDVTASFLNYKNPQDSPLLTLDCGQSPATSDLKSLGVKDVSSSFLSYQNPNKSPILGQPSNSLDLDTSDSLSKNDTSCKDKPNNYFIEDSGNREASPKKTEELKDSLLDENCNSLGYSSDLMCINSPSPKTEALLLADSNESNIQGPASVSNTIFKKCYALSEPISIYEREEKYDSDTVTSNRPDTEPITKKNNCEDSESNFTKDIHSLSFYDKFDIEPFGEGEPTEYDTPIPLPSPPPQELVDEVASLSPSKDLNSLERKETQSPGNLDNQFQPRPMKSVIVSKPADAKSISKSDNEVGTDRKPLRSSPSAVPSWEVPWISTDDAENADNNDPEWDLLKKLQTDEERYRVVREKWRHIEIPDPRRDLTCNNYRRSRSQFSMTRQSRKRRRSLDENGNEDQPSKRRRMVSCTAMYESRINDIQGEIHNQFMQLKAAHSKDLQRLSALQQEEHERFFYSDAPSHIVQREMNEILYKQNMEIQDLNVKYDAKLQKISKDKQDAIYLLRKASQEVLAFNKFYNDLGSSSDDHCDITEEELKQFNETEQMFQLYDSIYKG
ncbi:DNA-directed RNA polymerase subunit omega [Frankliniella fusca]|uniref:DNA-directed RNA polymerase subunit omega n=1 Tax=Frankliniella fusca TaxID=407009 RepID=A0AAE1H6T2_9NEOP|nr:DNA-directed RNA polymerase subunit omega [Frankliniella fusca]